MKLKTSYANLSIKYKILIPFYLIVIIVSFVLGFYSYNTSKRSVIDKVSSANLTVVRQVDRNIEFLQRETEDISTLLSSDKLVQSFLNNENKTSNKSSKGELYIDPSLKLRMNLIASKDYISMILLYSHNENSLPFYRSYLGNVEVNPFSNVKTSTLYQKISELNGNPIWLLLGNGDKLFMQNNRYQKIVMSRVIRDFNNYNNIGLIIMVVNESRIKKMYIDNLQESKGSMVIIDEQGNIVSQSGSDFYSKATKDQKFIRESDNNKEGYVVDHVSGRDMLIAYSSNNNAGWKLFYAVPMGTLTKETKSIAMFTLAVILVCLLFSFPLMFFISSLLTAPIKKLLKSINKFQAGNFDESVRFLYNDEIGQLGKGYDNMVANIKELINKAYILQIKEREAELTALQAQINPHFLYNTLDTIFWKAQKHGEKEIGDMIYSLSRLFRLSLNMGEGMTLVSSEKELIEQYLLLQKIRFKNKLSYEVQIDESILNNLVPKLILQPFVENAILHGFEGKENGGNITITGNNRDGKLLFIIEDDGIGMDEESVNNLLTIDNTHQKGTILPISRGYAVKNVNERFHLIFNENYKLKFISVPGMGTRVEILIPIIEKKEDGRNVNDKTSDC